MKKLAVALLSLAAVLFAAGAGFTADNTPPAKPGAGVKDGTAPKADAVKPSDTTKKPDVPGNAAKPDLTVKSDKPVTQDKKDSATKKDDKPAAAVVTTKDTPKDSGPAYAPKTSVEAKKHYKRHLSVRHHWKRYRKCRCHYRRHHLRYRVRHHHRYHHAARHGVSKKHSLNSAKTPTPPAEKKSTMSSPSVNKDSKPVDVKKDTK